MVNTYYDFDDYNSPVKTYLDDRFYYDFIGGYYKEADIYIQENSVEQKDSFFRYSPSGDESSFISIENVREIFKKESTSSKTAMSIKFYKDSKSKGYERQVFGLLEVFGNIGGVNEILEIGGGLIVTFFSAKLFLFSLISSLYQVDTTKIQENSSESRNHQVTYVQNFNEQEKQESNIKVEDVNNNEENKYDVKQSAEKIEIENLSVNHEDLDKELIHKASDNMKRRYRYSYSILDLAYSYLIPIKIFCCCKKTLRNIHTRYLLFKKGEEKFAKEFDAVSFVRNQRRLKMMINWLMDKSERFLAVYQKSNAISFYSLKLLFFKYYLV